MKRYGNLFGSIVSFQALLAASRKARRGKRYKVSTARFEHNLERELIRLHRQLTQKSYRPGVSLKSTNPNQEKSVPPLTGTGLCSMPFMLSSNLFLKGP